MNLKDMDIQELKQELFKTLNDIRTIVTNLVTVAKEFGKYYYTSYKTFKLSIQHTNYLKWNVFTTAGTNFKDYVKLGMLFNNKPITVVIIRKYQTSSQQVQLYFINIANRPLKMTFITDEDLRIMVIPQLYSRSRISVEKVYKFDEYCNNKLIEVVNDAEGLDVGKEYRDLAKYLEKLRDLHFRKKLINNIIFYKKVGVPKWFVYKIFIFDKRNYKDLLMKVMKDEKLKEEVQRAWKDYKRKRKQEKEKTKTKINLDLDLNFD